MGRNSVQALPRKMGKEVVLGTVFMLMGENSRTVARRVADKMAEVNRTLPEGIVARTIYDRTTLVDATIKTVKKIWLKALSLL